LLHQILSEDRAQKSFSIIDANSHEGWVSRRDPIHRGFFIGRRGRRSRLKRICVMDGQGGGIGATLIQYLKKHFGETVELVALGTNAIAAACMLKAGANKGASGENAICRTVAQMDCIVGPVAVTWANAMLGELTPKMAEAVMSCRAAKILLPLSQENAEFVGLSKEPLPHLVEAAVARVKEVMGDV
jgi:hypothetical protein